MNGRPLNDEEVSHIERFGWQIGDIPNLIATIRERDKTIADIRCEINSRRKDRLDDGMKIVKLEEKNEIMLSTLEWIRDKDPKPCHTQAVVDTHNMYKRKARYTIAQVKALTVSKQEESTVSEVACEQTNKDSLHVARQNIPTHSTEHMNRLAQEVESDMRWREGEQK